MEVVSLKLMYLCHVLHRLSKHFLTFNVAWLTKSNVMRWNITLATFAFVWFIPFKVLQKGQSIRSSQPNQISWPTASPPITRAVLRRKIVPVDNSVHLITHYCSNIFAVKHVGKHSTYLFFPDKSFLASIQQVNLNGPINNPLIHHSPQHSQLSNQVTSDSSLGL